MAGLVSAGVTAIGAGAEAAGASGAVAAGSLSQPWIANAARRTAPIIVVRIANTSISQFFHLQLFTAFAGGIICAEYFYQKKINLPVACAKIYFLPKAVKAIDIHKLPSETCSLAHPNFDNTLRFPPEKSLWPGKSSSRQEGRQTDAQTGDAEQLDPHAVCVSLENERIIAR